MAGRKTVLVTGGTGRQGGAVARSLLARGQKVRVLTRFPDRERARDLRSLGAEVVEGDFDDPDSLKPAVRGTDGVFLMGTPFEKGVRAEVAHGRAMVMACWKFGGPHIVYSSIAGANRETGIPHFESKRRVEEYIRQTEPPHTILRPAWFMENFESPMLFPAIQRGVLSMPLAPDTRLQMVSLADLGEFAAEAFIKPKPLLGEEIDLAGDELTLEEIADAVSEVQGRPLRYKAVPAGRVRSAVGRDFALMYRWIEEQGFGVDIEALRERWEIPLTSFRDYLRRSVIARQAA
jgi:uncharacterized protein YbjT (DUF2867 family)